MTSEAKDDLIARLNRRAATAHMSYYANLGENALLDKEAASAIARLKAENEKMREALIQTGSALRGATFPPNHPIWAAAALANAAISDNG